MSSRASTKCDERSLEISPNTTYLFEMTMDKSLSVYLHWPFCESKCPYCDFNSHVRDSFDEAAFLAAYKKELTLYENFHGRKINTIFFGGGTPSLMSPKLVENILAALQDFFGFTDNVEITLEANPSSTTSTRHRLNHASDSRAISSSGKKIALEFAGANSGNDLNFQKMADFKTAGINRISMGVQSFNDTHLKFLGRAHDATQARAAIEALSKLYERFSFDLIYALPNQSLDSWQSELRDALSYGTKHLSLYQLTIEPNTNFFHNKVKPAESELAADMYELTNRVCEEKGLHAYEVSNYAAHAHECRHNLCYWRVGDFIGIGPGAHGRFFDETGKRIATENIKSPEKYIFSVTENGNALANRQDVSDSLIQEYLLMSLRLKEGLDLNKVKYAINLENLEIFKQSGLIEDNNEKIIVSDTGRLVLNKIIEGLS